MINRQRIARLEKVLGTLIAWSAGSHMSLSQAQTLLDMLQDEKPIRKVKKNEQ